MTLWTLAVNKFYKLIRLSPCFGREREQWKKMEGTGKGRKGEDKREEMGQDYEYKGEEGKE